MGNMGGIERLMVFGILLIIITILGIAFFSANDIEGEFEANNESEPETGSAFDDDMGGVVDNYGSGATHIPENDSTAELGSTPLRNDVNVGRGDLEIDETGSEFGMEEEEIPVEDEVAQPKPAKYKIRKGDSFAKIARALLGDEKYTKVLVSANPQCDPLNLRVGDEITIPDITDASKAATANSSPIKNRTDPDIYIVQKADTLIKISEKLYGNKLDWKKLYEANRDILDDPNTLVPGTELRIPR